MMVINNSDIWENLRFSYHTIENLKAIYFYGNGKTKQDLHTVLLKLIAKKNEFNDDDSDFNKLINDTVNKYFRNNGASAVNAYWSALTELLDINFNDENLTLMYVLNPAHPFRKKATDEILLETYPVSFIDYKYSGAMIILTKDTPNKMLKKVIKKGE